LMLEDVAYIVQLGAENYASYCWKLLEIACWKGWCHGRWGEVWKRDLKAVCEACSNNLETNDLTGWIEVEGEASIRQHFNVENITSSVEMELHWCRKWLKKQYWWFLWACGTKIDQSYGKY
jgi:hypothetical protein